MLTHGTNEHPTSGRPPTRRAASGNVPAWPPQGQDLYLLISYAWAIEIVGVGCGVLNAGYTTFGDQYPDTIWGYIAALPMVVLAVAELGRIPLASAFFRRGKLIKGLCLVAIAALSYLTIENWTIGFERLFSMRLTDVMAAASALGRAEADLAMMATDHDLNASAQKRDELRAGVKAREASIAALLDQVKAASEAHGKNLVNIGQQCRLVKDACIKPRSESEDKRYESEIAPLNSMKVKEEQTKAALQAEIDDLVKSDASSAATRAERNFATTVALNLKREELRRAADSNPIYRVASSWFRTTQLTQEQFALVRWWFSTVSASAIALIGSVAAFVHYARTVVPGSPSFIATQAGKMIRARRAYFARKRKAVIREVRVAVFKDGKEYIYREGKEVVVKEVVRYVDRIVLIPHWGSGVVKYINALWWGHTPSAQQQPANNNNVPADKKVQ